MVPAPRTRTRNLMLTKQLLCQLSYAGESQPVVVRSKGLAVSMALVFVRRPAQREKVSG